MALLDIFQNDISHSFKRQVLHVN